jgi:hypothetical protein
VHAAGQILEHAGRGLAPVRRALGVDHPAVGAQRLGEQLGRLPDQRLGLERLVSPGRPRPGGDQQVGQPVGGEADRTQARVEPWASSTSVW